MKREIVPGRGMLIVYRVLVVLLLVLAALLIAGTLYSSIRPSGSEPLFRIGGGNRNGQNHDDETVNIFSDIGRLRIPLADAAGNQVATIILSISFPYPGEDPLFSEELASRTGEFRSIAVEYFASLPPEQLVRFNEEAVKAELLQRYNALLRLGRIETLYFGDLMVIE